MYMVNISASDIGALPGSNQMDEINLAYGGTVTIATFANIPPRMAETKGWIMRINCGKFNRMTLCLICKSSFVWWSDIRIFW